LGRRDEAAAAAIEGTNNYRCPSTATQRPQPPAQRSPTPTQAGKQQAPAHPAALALRVLRPRLQLLPDVHRVDVRHAAPLVRAVDARLLVALEAEDADLGVLWDSGCACGWVGGELGARADSEGCPFWPLPRACCNQLLEY